MLRPFAVTNLVFSNQAVQLIFSTILLTIISLASVNSAYPKVLGSQGDVFEIHEQDMRQLIGKKAASFDFLKWKYEQLERMYATIEKFRPADAVSGLPPSQTGEGYFVDLSYTLPYDIRDLHGNIVYPAGFTYNPLALMRNQGKGLDKIIVVINGTRENEITWFKNKFHNYKAKHLMVLITDGYAIELAKSLGRPVLYLPEVLKERFRIKETPSIVMQTPKSVNLSVKPYIVDHRGKELPSKRSEAAKKKVSQK